MDTIQDPAPRLGSEPSRPWIYWLLAVVCLGLGLTALLEFVLPFLPTEVAFVGAGGRPVWAWLVVGLALTGASLFFTWRAYRWQPPVADRARAENGLPVQIELGESGTAGLMHARIKHPAGIQDPLAAWKVELSGSGGEASPAAGRSTNALMYFDPQSGIPTAVCIENRFYSILPEKASIVPARGA